MQIIIAPSSKKKKSNRIEPKILYYITVLVFCCRILLHQIRKDYSVQRLCIRQLDIRPVRRYMYANFFSAQTLSTAYTNTILINTFCTRLQSNMHYCSIFPAGWVSKSLWGNALKKCKCYSRSHKRQMARMYVKNKDVLKCTLLPYCFDFLYNAFVIVCVAAAHLESVSKEIIVLVLFFIIFQDLALHVN